MKNNTTLLSAILMLFISYALPVACFAQAGSLDLTFDTDGIVTTSFGNYYNAGTSVAIQTDGKIVVAGISDNGPDRDFALARYNTDGTLDTTFDTDGKVTTDFGATSETALAMVIQSDGKIVVAGYRYVTASPNTFALVRYNTNGSLDTTFDTDGKVFTLIGSSSCGAFAIALQSDGKIVAAGTSSSNASFAVVRYNTNGSLDTSFDTDGIATTQIGNSNISVNAISIQSDNKILAAGAFNPGSAAEFILVRYNSNGSLDSTFDNDGIVITPIGTWSDVINAIDIQSDGKIVVAGMSYTAPTGYNFALIRYNTNGSLDTAFDNDGIVTTQIGTSYSKGKDLAIQSDGKIVVAGSSNNGNDNDITIVRYNTNGSLDTTFDTDGIVTTAIGTNTDAANSVALQSDGKIVVAGISIVGTDTVFAVVRYNNIIITGINEATIQTSEIKIYPNPFSSLTTIQTDKILNNATLTVYNIYGQEVKQLNNLFGQTITLNNDNLSSGVYFIQVTQENNPWVYHVLTNKLIVAE